MNKLLTIAIPTYNGASTIISTLSSIITQLEKTLKPEDYEIVISDDCSTDKTVGNIQKTYAEKVRLFQNENNLGMDKNFHQLAKLAKGKYIWFSGQDDIFQEGVVQKVIDAIRAYPSVGIVYINYTQYDESKKRIVCHSMFHEQVKDRRILQRPILHFHNAREYFSVFKDIPSFLPATIMLREFWDHTDTDAFIGTFFIQYTVMLQNMKNQEIVALTHPLIKGRIPVNGWQKNGDMLFNVTLGYLLAQTIVFFSEKNPIPPNIYKESKWHFIRQYIKLILLSKYYGLRSTKEQREKLKKIFGNGLLYYCYFLPLLLKPKLIAKNSFVDALLKK